MGAGLNKNQKLICNIMCFTATVSDLYKLLLLLLLCDMDVSCHRHFFPALLLNQQ